MTIDGVEVQNRREIRKIFKELRFVIKKKKKKTK